MPDIKITLKDGSSKTVRFADGFTDADIDEVANSLNSQIAVAPRPQPTPQPVNMGQTKPQFTGDYADIMNNNSLTKEQKKVAIQNRYDEINKQIDKDLRKDLTKLYAGAALEIGSAAIPVGAGAKAAGLAIKALKPYVGRKIAQEVGTGLVGGALSGGVFGAGRGLMEDKNILLTAGQDALSGGVFGAGTGAIAGNLGRHIAGKKLQKIEDVKDLRKAETKFYKDYLQESAVNRKDLGNIEFTGAGLETVSKQPEAGRNFATLKQDIKKATYLGEELPNHPRKDNIVKFHRLENNNQQFLIGETKEGKKYYLSKMKDELADQPSRVGTNPSDNIINDSTKNLNPETIKARSLEQSVLDAKGTPKEIKEIIKEDLPTYKAMNNEELIKQAAQDIEGNFDNELIRLASAKDFDALDYEKSHQIAQKLFGMGEYQKAVDLIDNVSENATKKGQAIQALSLWSNMTPEGAVYKAQKLIKEYNKKLPSKRHIKLSDDNIKTIANLQSEALNTTDELAKNQALAKSAKYISELVPKNALQKLKAYRNLSLLLNPKTLGRNIVGNALFNAVDTASKGLAAPIDATIGLFTKQRTRVAPNLAEYGRGLAQGAKTGYQEALQGIDTRGLGQRFDLGSGRTYKNKIGRGFEAALDVGLRTPDRAFYEATFAESVNNIMRARGLTKPTQEVLEQAEQEALEAVFQNKSGLSDSALWLRGGLNKLIGTKDFGLGDVLVPYAQTPANLAQQGINYSPFGVAKAINNLRLGNQRQASLDFARSLMGTGLIGAGYGLSKAGYMTPSQFSDNYKTNKTIKENLQPLGIRPDQIGDAWYAPFQPISIPLAVGNAMATGENPLQAGINTLVDLPALQNVSRGLRDLQEGDYAQAIYNVASSIPSQFVPTALSQLAQTVDTYQRETYDPDVIKRGINQAIAKVPFASKTLPEKVDVTGQPIERYQTEGARKLFDIFLNPTFINEKTYDPVLSELKYIYDNTKETSHFLPSVEKKLKFTDNEGNEQKIELTGEQLSQYQQELGRRMYEEFDYIMGMPEYASTNDYGKIKLLEKAKNLVKAEVDDELWNKRNRNKKRSYTYYNE